MSLDPAGPELSGLTEKPGFDTYETVSQRPLPLQLFPHLQQVLPNLLVQIVVSRLYPQPGGVSPQESG